MLDKQIVHQIALTRYANGQANTIKPYLLEIINYLDTRIKKEGNTIATKKRLNLLLKDTKEKLNSIYSEWYKEHLQTTLLDTAGLELDFQQQLHAKVETVRPSDAQALSAAKNNPLLIGTKGGAVDFTSFTTDWKPQEIKRVASMINAGFYTGETTDSIARGINGLKSSKYADGILNLSRANIQAMVRTSIAHQATAAKAEFGKGNEDIIKGVEIVATLDSRTSDECMSRDGDVYLYADNANPPLPPYHINCRTSYSYVYAPEFDYLKTGATRASKGADGGAQVSAKQTYYGWLKTQPAAFQDEALGKAKGKVFRNAGLTTDEFKQVAVNRFKQPLTIQQMKAKDIRIAEYLD